MGEMMDTCACAGKSAPFFCILYRRCINNSNVDVAVPVPWLRNVSMAVAHGRRRRRRSTPNFSHTYIYFVPRKKLLYIFFSVVLFPSPDNAAYFETTTHTGGVRGAAIMDPENPD